jgi:hypothetical protein
MIYAYRHTCLPLYIFEMFVDAVVIQKTAISIYMLFLGNGNFVIPLS